MEWLWWGLGAVALTPPLTFIVCAFYYGIKDKDDKPKPKSKAIEDDRYFNSTQRHNDHRQQHYEWDNEFYRLCGTPVYDYLNPLVSLGYLKVDEFHELSRMERDKHTHT